MAGIRHSAGAARHRERRRPGRLVAAGECRRHAAHLLRGRRPSRVRAAAEPRERCGESAGADSQGQGRSAHVRHQRGGLGRRLRLAEHHDAPDGAQQPGAAFPRWLAVRRVSLADEQERTARRHPRVLRMGHELRRVHCDRRRDSCRGLHHRQLRHRHAGGSGRVGELREQGQAPQRPLLGDRQRELRQLGSGQEHPAARPGDVRHALQGILEADEGRRSVDQDRRGGGARRRFLR